MITHKELASQMKILTPDGQGGLKQAEQVNIPYQIITVGDAATPDQTIKTDGGKIRLAELVPMQAVWDVGAVREWAVQNKYPDVDGWRKVAVERYRNALLRHVLRYIEDPYGVDDETGLPHLHHINTNGFFLAELEKGKFRLSDKAELEKDKFRLPDITEPEKVSKGGDNS